MKDSEIQALARILDRVDYYRLLKVERSAAPPAVRAAYRRMRRNFHPDAYQHRSEELREAVSQIAKRVNEGYQVLRDSGRRAAYDRSLERGELRISTRTEEEAKEQAEERTGSTASGRRFFQEAVQAERAGDLVAAVKSIKMALTFEPSNEHLQQKLADLEAKVPKKAKSSNPFAIR